MTRTEMDFENREIEALLREDALADTRPDPRIAMAELAPVIAREAARLRRIRKNRREGFMMLAATIPVTILLLLGANAFRVGNTDLVYGMAASAGILSLMALLTLPLMEKFLLEKG